LNFDYRSHQQNLDRLKPLSKDQINQYIPPPPPLT
jgi:hypothetical protein